jgi:hypothetical protein
MARAVFSEHWELQEIFDLVVGLRSYRAGSNRMANTGAQTQQEPPGGQPPMGSNVSVQDLDYQVNISAPLRR